MAVDMSPACMSHVPLAPMIIVHLKSPCQPSLHGRLQMAECKLCWPASKSAGNGVQVTGTTPLQMLKAILLRLSRSAAPFLGDQSLAVPSSVEPSAPELQSFIKAFECVFLDVSGHVNLAAGLLGSTAKLVSPAAKYLPCSYPIG